MSGTLDPYGRGTLQGNAAFFADLGVSLAGRGCGCQSCYNLQPLLIGESLGDGFLFNCCVDQDSLAVYCTFHCLTRLEFKETRELDRHREVVLEVLLLCILQRLSPLQLHIVLCLRFSNTTPESYGPGHPAPVALRLGQTIALPANMPRRKQSLFAVVWSLGS